MVGFLFVSLDADEQDSLGARGRPGSVVTDRAASSVRRNPRPALLVRAKEAAASYTPTLGRMLDRFRTSPRVFPLVAAPVLGVLGVVEASADPEFRDSFVQLVLVARGSPPRSWSRPGGPRWARAGRLLLPAHRGVRAPGPGGTGLIAVMLAMGYAGYAAPPRRSMVAVTVAVLVFIVTSWVVDGPSWDTVFFPTVFYPARWAGPAGQPRAGAQCPTRRAHRPAGRAA